MKPLKSTILTLLCLSIVSVALTAQNKDSQYAVRKANVGISSKNITTKRIPLLATTTFVSPENIKYVDISTKHAHGDLSGKNIFRLRVDSAAFANGGSFEVTIVTTSYVAVYRLLPVYQNCILQSRLKNPRYMGPEKNNVSYVITINPNNAVQINQHGALTKRQCFDLAIQAMDKKPSIKNIKAKQYGLEVRVNNIFVVGDYLIFDLSIENKRNLQFNIDQIRWKIIDKKLVKATVSQDIEIHPVYRLYDDEGTTVRKKWRNLYILKKFTYPTEKYLQIQVTEKQISGRKIDVKIDYNQILKSSVLM